MKLPLTISLLASSRTATLERCLDSAAGGSGRAYRCFYRNGRACPADSGALYGSGNPLHLVQ